MRGISGLAEDRLASQEGLSCMGWVFEMFVFGFHTIPLMFRLPTSATSRYDTGSKQIKKERLCPL